MKFWRLVIGVLALSACSVAGIAPGSSGSSSAQNGRGNDMQIKTDLPNLGAAPELANTVWLNTDHPLRFKNLRGKVVLLEMWTFECINCQHVIPSVRSWYQKYNAQGLEVIGNHFPEFSYEADWTNVQAAVKQLDVPYPVAQDNDGVTWRAYNTRAWPSLYLIDKQGNLRYTHIGEGAYIETEAAIQSLLAAPYSG
jgi:thiol-disulfide isomerase/thioredoxin